MNFGKSYTKAAIDYTRDCDHDVEFTFDISKPTCIIIEIECSDVVSAQRYYTNCNFFLCKRKTFGTEVDGEYSKEILSSAPTSIRYIIKAERKNDYYVIINSKQFKGNVSIKVYEENWVYAPHGAIAYSSAIRDNNIIYRDYNQIFVDAETFKEISLYNHVDDTIRSDKDRLHHAIVADMMRVYDKKFAKANAVKDAADILATSATYAGVPFLALSGTAATILGGGVTVLGAVATTVSLGCGFHKNGYEKTLFSSIETDNYNLVLTTYSSSVDLIDPEEQPYIDIIGEATWSSWNNSGYINRIVGESILDVSVGLQAEVLE